ncbi:MAG: tRNA(His) guanylyltransferase Thg1 family protein [Candidatus Bathycorpusculaceae bacterium]
MCRRPGRFWQNTFRKRFNPAFIYIVSDELNILFTSSAPFRGRVEKIDSVISSMISTAFALRLQKLFGKTVIAAFDSRIVIMLNDEEILNYMIWRQTNAWRNHNNAYVYWLFRKMGQSPKEIAKMLRGMKTEEIHETLFKHGINLAQTPSWQRRGTLLYKEPYRKITAEKQTIRCKIKENWNLPLFSKDNGAKLIQQILKWVKEKRRV